MQYLVDGYHGESAAAAPVSERAAFIRRTYGHLLGAVVAFVAVEAAFLASGVGLEMLKSIRSAGSIGWIALMVAFIAGGFAAQWMARSKQGVGVQYAGLALYVLIEAVIFLPILTIATQFPQFAGKNLPLQAGIVTLVAFGGLTAAVVWSKRDFSFMGPFLGVMSFLALGFVIAAVVFGFSLGLVFSVAMVALAAGFILYDTSNVLHHHGTDEHVAASLSLFASVALMFYYVLRIFMATSSDD
jgi:FtsH-binding integral membrane protein